MCNYIRQVSPKRDVLDQFEWNNNTEHGFTINCYDMFKSKLSGPPFNARIVKAFNQLWKVKVRPKFFFFGWKIIHNRLSTKNQLIKQGVTGVSGDLKCVFCLSEKECLSHLLGGCVVVSNVWKKVFEWIGYGEQGRP